MLGPTLRKDAWWVGPALTVVVLLGFIVYATLRAFEGGNYEWRRVPLALLLAVLRRLVGEGLGPLASSRRRCSSCRGPRRSVSLVTTTARPTTARSRGTRPRAPSPSASAHRYNGETQAPRSSRTCTATRCTWRSCSSSSSGRTRSMAVVGWKDGVHVGVGTLVMIVNCVLLTGYTFGCHSFRHLVGGGVNSYSKAALGGVRHGLWKLVTVLNERHQPLAWASLFSRGADRSLHPHGRHGRHHRREALLNDEPTSTRRTSTTCSSSARAAPGCARPSRRAPTGRAWASSASRSSARRTP